MTRSPNSMLIAAFAAMRFAVGAGSWLAPAASARFFGLGSENQQPFITQLFGSRDLALAIAITDTTSPQLRTRALQLGVLADTLDTIAALRGISRHTLSTRGAILGGGGAVFFAGLGLAALAAQEHPGSPLANTADLTPRSALATIRSSPTWSAATAIITPWISRPAPKDGNPHQEN